MSSREVNDAEGSAPARVVDVLNEKRAALEAASERYKRAKEMRDEIAMSEESRLTDSLRDLIAVLEIEVAEATESGATQKAKSRVVAIKRAFGSVTNELDEDEKRVVEKIVELQAAIGRLNDRYSKAATLKAEAAALSDRFGLDKPELPVVIPPVRRDFVGKLVTLDRGLSDHASIRQPLEQCVYKLRTRRTYAEIKQTPGFEIIQAAGLKAFPPLTERQAEIVEGRERQHEETRQQFARHAGEARERLGSSS
jgi:hypothetical protein